MLTRAPRPPLRPFVLALWATEPGDLVVRAAAPRERVLPTGTTSMSFLLGEPLRLFRDAADTTGFAVDRAVVGGPRDTFYLKDVSRPALSVGAQLCPGAAELLLGAPAGELAGCHTRLEDLWGRRAGDVLERLAAVPSAAARIDALEAILLASLPSVRGVHPAVAEALARFSAAPTAAVREVVEATGYSQRRLLTLFRDAVGLGPKSYARILRFQHAVAHFAARPAPRPIDVALDAGYCDQPHLSRDFRAIAGISPERYRHAAPLHANHVPVRA